MIKGVLIFESQYGLEVGQQIVTEIAQTNATDLIFSTLFTEEASAEAMAEAINIAVDVSPSKSIWIGTPSVNSNNYSSSTTTYEQLIAFTNSVYNLINDTAKLKVRGIYMNQESFYSGTIDYDNFSQNMEVLRMMDIKNYAKSNNWEFLWVPYYGYGDNAAKIIKDIGYGADSVQIFDYVVMQPHYMFDATVQSNLQGVKLSCDANKVTYRDGVAVIANKVSVTDIGFEMEYVQGNPKYDEYYDKYYSIRNSSPSVFYWQGATVIEAIDAVNVINAFYN